MFNNKFKFDAAADLAKSILEADVKAKMEALKGDQVKLDKNRNGKLDAQDFKILRGEKKVNEAEADYQSSYRVGKTANFKPKASDVGQGRKITGKMGKYGKQPDDDNMVEPPPEHKVGDVKTDPSAVVPGHSTIAAKLHLQTLPKDAEGNPIVKGARKVNAADLVAKRKAMMAADEKAKKDQKNEEYEQLDEIGDTPAGKAALQSYVDKAEKQVDAHWDKVRDQSHLPSDKRMVNRARSTRKADQRILGFHKYGGANKGYGAGPGPSRNEEYVEEGMEDTLHPAGAALLKHIKPEHHNLYKAHLTKDVFNGGFGDRHAVLKAAQDAGHLKMDLRKQNEEVESITEGKMDKMTLSGLWHKHAQHSYMSDQGYGLGSGSMHHNDHAATAIENHVRKHYGNKVADDMVAHSEHHVAHAEYAGPESSPHHEKEADKLRKKHGIHGDLYGEEVEHDVDMINERELTSGETKEKERIVHGMKKSLKGFKARYGDRAKEVMYATATKQAKKD
jgi:hypothetical protein